MWAFLKSGRYINYFKYYMRMLMANVDYLKWATSTINPSNKPSLEKIKTNLSIVLRFVNSSDLINPK